MNEIKPWTMTDGIIIEYKDVETNNIYRLVPNGHKEIKQVEVSSIIRSYKKKKPGEPNMIQKYIIDKGLNVFNIKKFMDENPQQLKNRSRIDLYVVELIRNKYLCQLNSDGDFKVNFLGDKPK